MTTRNSQRWRNYAIAIVGTIVIADSNLLWLRIVPWKALPPHAFLVACMLVMAFALAWAIYFSVRAYQSEDEYQQSVAKDAWYWGSAGGLGIAALLAMFVSLGGLHWVDPNIRFGAPLILSFYAGFLVAPVAQGLGFAVAVAWLRYARR